MRLPSWATVETWNRYSVSGRMPTTRTVVDVTVPSDLPSTWMAYRVPLPAGFQVRRAELVVTSLTRRARCGPPGVADGDAVVLAEADADALGRALADTEGWGRAEALADRLGAALADGVGAGAGEPPPRIRNSLLATFQCVAR